MRKIMVLIALLLAVPVLAEPTPAPSAGSGDHSGHMPEPPPFTPLTVADIEPIDALDLAPLVEKGPIPPSMAPDVVGAFRFICNVGHLSYDDPIAYPGQPGKSHLHMFFGNTQVDAHSDYASLRRSGDGSCQGGALNRSAYWIPALLTKAEGGQVVVPDSVALYYKRRPTSDPECGRPNPDFTNGTCHGIPVGLRAIFGTNYILGHKESPHVRFDCNTMESVSASLTETVARCAGASHIYARIESPDCWDGVNLDSTDHQSHLAYAFWDGRTGKQACPKTHRVTIPQLTLTMIYAVLPGDTPETWIFSSDVQAGKPAGTTFHADYMEAWEPEARLVWERNCLDGFLSCAGGDLGDGRGMKWPEGFTFEQRPHLVAVPVR